MNNLFAKSKNGIVVYSHPEAHPHLTNDDAKSAIGLMTIPEKPENPDDRSQTRVCETVDLGRIVGFNYRTELKPGMRTFMMCRGDGRNWESLMTIDGMPTPVTIITSSVIWDSENNIWVLWTNFAGEDDPWPEPGSARFNNLSEEDKKKAAEWHANHPLICTEEQIKKAKELGLIRKLWYFWIGEDEPRWGIQQPWTKWSEKLGPFETKEKAKEEEKIQNKKMKGEREWVEPPYSEYERTWLDEARKQQSENASYLDRMEKFKERIKENEARWPGEKFELLARARITKTKNEQDILDALLDKCV